MPLSSSGSEDEIESRSSSSSQQSVADDYTDSDTLSQTNNISEEKESSDDDEMEDSSVAVGEESSLRIESFADSSSAPGVRQRKINSGDDLPTLENAELDSSYTPADAEDFSFLFDLENPFEKDHRTMIESTYKSSRIGRFFTYHPCLILFFVLGISLFLTVLVFALHGFSMDNEDTYFVASNTEITDIYEGFTVAVDDTVFDAYEERLRTQLIPTRTQPTYHMTVIYDGHGVDLLHPDSLQKILDLENSITGYSKFSEYCLLMNLTGGSSLNCAGWSSATKFFIDSSTGRITQNSSAIREIVENVMTENDRYTYLGKDLSDGNAAQTQSMRTFLSFGAPLKGYRNYYDDPDAQDFEFRKFVLHYREDFEDFMKDAKSDDIHVYYIASELTHADVDDIVAFDASLAALSLAFIFIYSCLNIGNVFLAAAGMLDIVLSFPLAFFVYRVLIGIEHFNTLNGLGLFIIAGIGADDVFIMVDHYRATLHMHPNISHSLENKISFAWSSATRAMFVTSFTTATAFLACVVSSISIIRFFGIFCALLVIFNYLLCITYFSAILVIQEKYISPVWKFLTPRLFRGAISCDCIPWCLHSILDFLHSGHNNSDVDGGELGREGKRKRKRKRRTNKLGGEGVESPMSNENRYTEISRDSTAKSVDGLLESVENADENDTEQPLRDAEEIEKNDAHEAFEANLARELDMLSAFGNAPKKSKKSKKSKTKTKDCGGDMTSEFEKEFFGRDLASITNFDSFRPNPLTSPLRFLLRLLWGPRGQGQPPFLSPDSDTSPDGVNVSTLRFAERFFYQFHSFSIHRWRYPLTLLMFLIFGVFLYFALNLPPEDGPTKLLAEDHSVQQAFSLSREKFHGTTEDQMTVHFIWGIDGIDDRDTSKWKDPSDIGVPIWDSFNLSLPVCQEWLLDFCGKLKNHTRIVSEHHVTCFIEDFRDYINNVTLDSFPVNSLSFESHLWNFTTWMRNNRDITNRNVYRKQGQSYDECVGFDPSTLILRWVSVFGEIKTVGLQPPRVVRGYYDEFETMRDNIEFSSSTPPQMRNVVQTSQMYVRMVTSESMTRSGIIGVFIALLVANIVVFLMTLNFLVTFVAGFSMATIVVIVIGMMTLIGWKLGLLQSIILSIVGGFSADYVVHFAFGFHTSKHFTRYRKTRDSVTEMGISVLSAGLTTAGASIFLFFTIITLFADFGKFIAINILAALLVAFFPTLGLLMVIGPVHGFCGLPSYSTMITAMTDALSDAFEPLSKKLDPFSSKDDRKSQSSTNDGNNQNVEDGDDCSLIRFADYSQEELANAEPAPAVMFKTALLDRQRKEQEEAAFASHATVVGNNHDIMNENNEDNEDGVKKEVESEEEDHSSSDGGEESSDSE